MARFRARAGTKTVLTVLRELLSANLITSDEYAYAVKFIDAAFTLMRTRAVYRRDKAVAIAITALAVSCVARRRINKVIRYAVGRYGFAVAGYLTRVLPRAIRESRTTCMLKLGMEFNCNYEIPQYTDNPGLDAYLIATNKCNAPMTRAEKLFL